MRALRFADGEELEVDMVVFSAGIRARDELARSSGLAIGERGGITIDGCCRTSDADVFAIGECALFDGKTYGLVAPGYRMAEVAAAAIAGEEQQQFDGFDMSTKLKLLGVDVGSFGDAFGKTPGAKVVSLIDGGNGRLQEAGPQRRQEAAARRHAGRRRLGVHAARRVRAVRDRAARAPGGADRAAARGRQAGRLRRRCAARRGDDLLVQQREQGRDLLRRSAIRS